MASPWGFTNRDPQRDRRANRTSTFAEESPRHHSLAVDDRRRASGRSDTVRFLTFWSPTRLGSLPLRRRRLLLTALTLALTISPIATASNADAGTIAQTEVEIAILSTRLSHLSQAGETSANAYDAAKERVARIDRRIGALEVQKVLARHAIATTTNLLSAAVVRAYVLGAYQLQTPSVFDQTATQQAARQVYEYLVAADLRRLQRAYQSQLTSLQSTLVEIDHQRSDARRTTIVMRSLLAQNNRNEAATRATLDSMTQSVKSRIVTNEVQLGVAAARRHDVAGEIQAVTAASSVGGQDAANRVTAAIQAATPAPAITQVPASAKGLAAVKFAESQLGVPYVWGGESPGVGFDCSGLVQWAWAKVGVTIPRTTESQWPALEHVPLTSLQPGDLLYYFNLDGDHLVDHLVMYVGSGPFGASTVIAAAHSGTTVSYAPIFTAGLIGAARP